jgi:hypothetical protein
MRMLDILLFIIIIIQTNPSYSSNNTAILNIHWGMNPEQVQNAINTGLEEEPISTDKIKLFNNRLRIADRGRLAEVKYYFYRNQLYKLEIRKDLAMYKKPIINQLIKQKGLDQQFNNIIQTLYNGSKYETIKDNQKIVFYLNSNDLNSSDTVFLDLDYLPIANQIY